MSKLLSWAGWLLVVVVRAIWWLRPSNHWIGAKAGAIISPTHGEMRGSIGGNTWSRNKGGPYVRARGRPTNPQTSRQQTTRTILGSKASVWSEGLTQDQRDLWDVYAAGHAIKNSLGEDILISGLAWFVKVNSRLADAGMGAMVEPPLFGAPSAVDTLAVDISAIATADVTFTGTPVVAGGVMQLWVSLPVSLGSTPNLAQCRLVGYSGVAQASPWAATLPHGFQSGLRGVFYAGIMSEEGLMSAYLQAIDDSDY